MVPIGAVGQRSFHGLLLTHFEERRDKQLSLDRLGPTGIIVTPKAYLIPRAIHLGTKFNPSRKFNGWYVVSVKHLKNGYNRKCFPVIASPQDGQDLECNDFHAHSEIPNDLDYKTAALYLREIFVKNGFLEEYKEQEVEIDASETFIDRWKNWVKNVLAWSRP